MIHHPSFDELWKVSSKEDRKLFNDLLNDHDKKGISKWIKEHNYNELGELSVRVLRARAKERYIKNWSRLSKAELIGILNEKENVKQD